MSPFQMLGGLEISLDVLSESLEDPFQNNRRITLNVFGVSEILTLHRKEKKTYATNSNVYVIKQVLFV